MNRRTFLHCTAGAAFTARHAAGVAPAPASSGRLNVLLILVDDLNTQLGCYGHPFAHTPQIDRLAARGVRFDRAYCSFPLCTPARTALLTGLRPDATGVTSLDIHFRQHRPDVVTLPELFRRHGYFTARAGKIFHMGVPDAIAVRGSGLDDPRAWDVAVNAPGYELNSNGSFYNATPWEKARAGTGGAIGWLRAEGPDERQHDFNVTTELIRLLDQRGEQPFFLAAGFIRPHVPLVAPRRFFERFEAVQVPLPFGDRSALLPEIRRYFGADFDLSAEETRNAIRAYHACVSFMDEQVGRLLDALDDRGLLEQTLVVFTSDHGFQLGERGLWFKKFLFEESARVPLIVADPRRPGAHGSVCRSLVEHVDVYGTVAACCGLSPATRSGGAGLVPLLDNPARKLKSAAFVQTAQKMAGGFSTGRSLRTERWIYNEWNDGRDGVELYDLEADPRQLRNLAPALAGSSTLREFAARLHAGPG